MTAIKTADLILVAGQNILLIRRAKNPFKGLLAFPGGRLDPDEYELETQAPGTGLRKAAARELSEEVGINVDANEISPLIELIGLGRDPRPGHGYAAVFWLQVSESVLHSASAASDASSVHVVDLNKITPNEMAFDHYRAIEQLREVLT
jgi:8-oxo-dGTP diphosphatase